MILLSFYIYEVLEQLKTNIHTNSYFKRALHIVIDYT